METATGSQERDTHNATEYVIFHQISGVCYSVNIFVGTTPIITSTVESYAISSLPQTSFIAGSQSHFQQHRRYERIDEEPSLASYWNFAINGLGESSVFVTPFFSKFCDPRAKTNLPRFVFSWHQCTTSHHHCRHSNFFWHSRGDALVEPERNSNNRGLRRALLSSSHNHQKERLPSTNRLCVQQQLYRHWRNGLEFVTSQFISTKYSEPWIPPRNERTRTQMTTLLLPENSFCR